MSHINRSSPNDPRHADPALADGLHASVRDTLHLLIELLVRLSLSTKSLPRPSGLETAPRQ
jgi:hypothetical protein